MNTGIARRTVAAAAAILLIGSGASAGTAYVLSNGYVNVRERPSSHGNIVGKMNNGQVVEYDLIGIDTNDNEWYRTKNGYVHSGYCVFNPPYVSDDLYAWVIEKDKIYSMADTRSEAVRKIKPGEYIHITAWEAEWCLTAEGYVKTSSLRRVQK